MRGDVFRRPRFPQIGDFGPGSDPKSKTKNIDFDVDLKLGFVAGNNGEALRSVDAKFSRRGGNIKAFALTAGSVATRR